MAKLSELLATQSLGLRLVQSGPGDPEISWVSTTELTDLSAYLDGGELVLTTGLSLGPHDPAWRDFVAALARARVAAIGFGVGVTHDRIPAPLVAAASDFRLPLVEVPPPTPFIAVSKAVAGLLSGDELHSAHRALGAQQRIIDAAVGGRGPAAVLAILSSAIGRQVGVIDQGGAVEAATAGFLAPEAPIDPMRVPPGWSFHPLDFEGSGRLLLVHGEQLDGPAARAAVTAASIALGLEQRQRALEEEHARARWSRAAELVLRDAPGAVSATQVLDPAFTLPADVRVLGLQGTPEDLAAWHRTLRSGTGRLVLRGAGTAPGVSAPRDGALAAPRDLARAWQLIDDTAEAVQAALLSATGHGLDAAVGRPASPRTLSASRSSTLVLLNTFSPSAPLYVAPRKPIVRWAERDAPLLESLIVSGDSAPILAVLGRLALSSHPGGDGTGDEPPLDSEERTMLRGTLRAFLEHAGRPGPAADALGVHRNTLSARIRRAEAVTGRSVQLADDRAELWLALRAEELLAPGET